MATVTLEGGQPVEYTDLHEALVAGSAAGSVVELIDNVDLKGKNWVPVFGFKGTFDGKGFIISNLTITTTVDITVPSGIFPAAGLVTDGGQIVNLTVVNPTVNTPSSTYCGAISGDGTVVSNVTVCGKITIRGTKYVAALVGHGEYKKFVDCHVDGGDANDSLISALGNGKVGGIYGMAGEDAGHVYNCSVKNVTIEGADCVGAVIGRLHRGVKCVNCEAENVVLKCDAATMGALAGDFQSDSSKGDVSYVINPTLTNVTLCKLDGTPTEYSAYGNLSATKEVVVGEDVEGNLAYDASRFDFTAGTFEAFGNALTMAKAGLTAQCATNYEPVDNKDGTYTITYIPPVAQIGTTPYTTLKAAFAAVKPTETIELLSNVELTEKIVLENVKCTVDLKGFKITNAESWVLTTFDWLFDILGGCDITFDNGTIELNDRMIYFRLGSVVTFGSELVVDAKKVQYTDNTIRGFGGTLNVYGKVMRAGGEANAFDLPISNSVVNVYAGADISVTPSSGNSCYIFKVGSAAGTAPAVNISGGTIGDATVVFWTYNPNQAVMTITGGTFEGDSSMFAMLGDNPSNATVTPMTDECTAKFASEIKGLDGLCATGFAPVLGNDGYYTIAKVWDVTFYVGDVVSNAQVVVNGECAKEFAYDTETIEAWTNAAGVAFAFTTPITEATTLYAQLKSTGPDLPIQPDEELTDDGKAAAAEVAEVFGDDLATWVAKVYGDGGKIPASKLNATTLDLIAIAQAYDLPIMTTETEIEIEKAAEGDGFTFQIVDDGTPVAMQAAKVLSMVQFTADLGVAFDAATTDNVEVALSTDSKTATATFKKATNAGFMKVKLAKPTK